MSTEAMDLSRTITEAAETALRSYETQPTITVEEACDRAASRFGLASSVVLSRVQYLTDDGAGMERAERAFGA